MIHFLICCPLLSSLLIKAACTLVSALILDEAEEVGLLVLLLALVLLVLLVVFLYNSKL